MHVQGPPKYAPGSNDFDVLLTRLNPQTNINLHR